MHGVFFSSFPFLFFFRLEKGFVGSQDDGVNVHGTHLQIVAQPSATSIVVQFMQRESYGFLAFFPGDKVQFTRADTLVSFGTCVSIRS